MSNSATATPQTMPPLLVDAKEAGRLCGRSEASWWREERGRTLDRGSMAGPWAGLWGRSVSDR